MRQLVIVIPNNAKCAPNDIALSQALQFQELGYEVTVIYFRRKVGDYQFDNLTIQQLLSVNSINKLYSADMLILHMFLPSLLAFFVRKCISYVHSDITPDCLDQFGKFKGWFAQATWKRALAKADCIAVVSNHLRERLIKANISDEQKIFVVPTTTQHPLVYDLSAQTTSKKNCFICCKFSRRP